MIKFTDNINVSGHFNILFIDDGDNLQNSTKHTINLNPPIPRLGKVIRRKPTNQTGKFTVLIKFIN